MEKNNSSLSMGNSFVSFLGLVPLTLFFSTSIDDILVEQKGKTKLPQKQEFNIDTKTKDDVEKFMDSIFGRGVKSGFECSYEEFENHTCT